MKPISQLTLLALALATTLNAEPIPEALRQNGWFIGAQAYTFKEFTTFEAISKTKEAGGNMIEIYPGQRMKPDSDVKVAFHEHGGSMSNPKYKVWHPLYIRGVVESRDERVEGQRAPGEGGHRLRESES